jgi:predicted phosphodiesterase
MRFNRRKFLVLGGLASLSFVGLWEFVKNLVGQRAHSTIPPIAPAVPGAQIPSQKPLLRFVAIADAGAGDHNQNAVAQAMTRYHQQFPYSLVVMAGDNIYNDGEISRIGVAFEQPYQALLGQDVKFRACLGNHDIRTDNGNSQLRYPGYNMAGRFYTFREKTVQFFVLDTNVNADWQGQLTWLKQELSRSTAPWKVVFGHHPIYSSGRYGTNPEFVKVLSPLFKQYGVQLYINGHEHNYERTRPIDGTTYLITGNAGASLRQVGRSEWTAHSNSLYGFTALEVRSDHIEVKAIAATDELFDRGIIPITTRILTQ